MNKLMIVGIVFLTVVLVVAGIFVYDTYAKPVPKNTTQLINTNTNYPVPTGSSGTSPGTSEGILWQSLLITEVSGSTYWVNPPQALSLQSILFGAPSGSSNFAQVSSEANGIWVNLDSSVGTVSSWTLSCQETIQITDLSGNVIGTVCSNTQINANGGSLSTGTNQVLTSSGQFTASSIQSVIAAVVPTSSGLQYNFVVTLANIQLTLNASSGQLILSTSTPDSSNTLTWAIEFQ